VPTLAISLALVAGLALLANRLAVWGNAPFGRQVLEYPLWAAVLGIVANPILRATGTWGWVRGGLHTELFLKAGLVLMGASVDIAATLSIGAKGIVQAVVLITSVFFFTWFVSRAFGLDHTLRALMSASVSIGGLSAAIAAAGSVAAHRRQLSYVTSLVVLFALPLMVLEPYAARLLDLPPDVAGAWMGGNIDTTAAVVGAAAVHSEAAMKVASIVKMSQNALLGVAAFLLALYWVVKVERKPDQKPSPLEIWRRFPKFVLGFALASVVVSLGFLGKQQVADITNLRNWFLTFAFVSIGLEFAFAELGRFGAKPLLVYLLATVFNTVVALGVAWVLFGGLIDI